MPIIDGGKARATMTNVTRMVVTDKLTRHAASRRTCCKQI